MGKNHEHNSLHQGFPRDNTQSKPFTGSISQSLSHKSNLVVVYKIQGLTHRHAVEYTIKWHLRIKSAP